MKHAKRNKNKATPAQDEAAGQAPSHAGAKPSTEPPSPGETPARDGAETPGQSEAEPSAEAPGPDETLARGRTETPARSEAGSSAETPGPDQDGVETPGQDALGARQDGAGAGAPARDDASLGDDVGGLAGALRRVLGIAWFQVALYVRSGQVVFPLVLLALIIAAQSGMPSSPAVSFADAGAFALPVFALATHQLLGAEPDAQRAISVRNAGSRRVYLTAGLLAALAVNLVFLLLSTASALRGPLAGHTLVGGSVLTTIIVGLAVHLLMYLPGVALGALTTRTVTGDAPAEYVALVGGLLLAVLPGLASGPVSWIALPLFRLLRAANDHRLELAAPGIALHVAIWTAVVTAAYVLLRLRRRSA